MQNTIFKHPRPERGESLVEVLAAMAILLLVLVSILQLFSLSILSFHATTAHRDMMRRAQEIVEVIRMAASTASTNTTSGASGIFPLASGTFQLPTSSSETGFDFWGPSGFNVVEEGAPFKVNVNVADDNTQWLVTVFVEPSSNGAGRKYLGPVSKKGVRYAARIPK